MTPSQPNAPWGQDTPTRARTRLRSRLILAMAKAWLHGLVWGALAFVAIVGIAILRGDTAFDDAGSMIVGGVFFLFFFGMYAAIFSIPFLILAMVIAAVFPRWTDRNPWLLSASMTALVGAAFTLAQTFQFAAVGIAILIAGLFASRWRRISP